MCPNSNISPCLKESAAMNVTTGKGFSLMKNTTRNYLVKRFRPVVIFIHRHHPARLLYAFFVFIVLAVIGSIIEAFFQFGKLPGLSDFQKTYVFQVAIDFPYFSVPFMLLSIVLLPLGWYLDRREKQQRREKEGGGACRGERKHMHRRERESACVREKRRRAHTSEREEGEHVHRREERESTYARERRGRVYALRTYRRRELANRSGHMRGGS